MPHYDTFRHQLAITHPDFGHALWDTNPGDQPPVETGDVGFIRQGKFHRLFNALYSEDHPSNARFGVPEDHEQLFPVSNHIDHAILPPNNFCSYGVTVTSSETGVHAAGPSAPDTADVSFSCTTKQGAVLSLPVAAQREDTLALAQFRKWITRHIDSWYAFSQRQGLGIEMEEILLVTGCHRARSSGNVVFYESQVDARVSFGVHVPGMIGNTIIWRVSSQHIQGAVVNQGPSGENLPENQCLFVRGFRVERTFRIFSKIAAAAEPKPDPSGNDAEPERKVVLIPGVTGVRSLYCSLLVPHLVLKYRDPLYVLLEHIAERAPQSDLVLVHDDDLAQIREAHDLDMTPLETCQPVAVMNHLRRLKLEVGVSDFGPANKKGTKPDKDHMAVAMLSNQLNSLDQGLDVFLADTFPSLSNSEREFCYEGPDDWESVPSALESQWLSFPLSKSVPSDSELEQSSSLLSESALTVPWTSRLPGPGPTTSSGDCPFCDICGKRFARLQELKRHANEVHKPLRQCPFCAYHWKRVDKIKTHVLGVHQDVLSEEVLQQLRGLRGQDVVKFLDTHVTISSTSQLR
ncbi:hypothetical protein EI94DRAFT_1831716 [Lactarius quietus]|nr:hypothetical protein EI94DRAFT_1831716 [Lactarius quietus]